MSDNTPLLYHYTNKAGLLGILESGKLWASKIKYLNDTEELDLAIGTAKSYMSFIINGDEDENRKALVSDLLHELEMIEHINIFVFCFSELPDSLSLWRGYGPNGGYCLGFNRDELEYVAKQSNCILSKCIYTLSEHETAVSNLIQLAIDNETLCNKTEIGQSQFVVNFLELAPLMKSASFSEEKEWRLLTHVEKSSDERTKFRLTTQRIVPFREIPLREKQSGAGLIKEIIIGPCKEKELERNTLNMLNWKYDLGAPNIRFSSVPYRDW